MKPFKKIVVATDFSPHSARALEVAGEFAKHFGAEVTVVHAFNVPIPLVTPYEVAIPDTYIEEARTAATERLHKAAQKLSAQGIAVKSELTEIPAWSAIVRVAKESGADLIVMGTRGHTGFKHVLLGSIAERTLRHAPCPVLTVKDEAH